MSGKSDDLFGDDPNHEAEDTEGLMDRLFQLISEFVEDEDLTNEALPPLLFQTALSVLMMNYVVRAAKPSAGGLKLELDRYRSDIDHLIRAAKKSADQTVTIMTETIAAAADLDDVEDEA